MDVGQIVFLAFVENAVFTRLKRLGIARLVEQDELFPAFLDELDGAYKEACEKFKQHVSVEAVEEELTQRIRMWEELFREAG